MSWCHLSESSKGETIIIAKYPITWNIATECARPWIRKIAWINLTRWRMGRVITSQKSHRRQAAAWLAVIYHGWGWRETQIQKRTSKCDSFMRLCSGEGTGSDGRGVGASQKASEGFAWCQGEQNADVGAACPWKRGMISCSLQITLKSPSWGYFITNYKAAIENSWLSSSLPKGRSVTPQKSVEFILIYWV